MKIAFVEIQNFRKLKSVRIDFSEKTTLFVGANNSGKTTAMVALRRFLKYPNELDLQDFTICGWRAIDKIGRLWEKSKEAPKDLTGCSEILPSIDVWLYVEMNEIHYVSHLIPTLDWNGGLLGVRLRLEPENIESLYVEYRKHREHVKKANPKKKFPLWPTNLKEFLDKKFSSAFAVHSYLLDPSKLIDPKNGFAEPQKLPDDLEPIKGDPFSGLIRINEINAQRGFSDAGTDRGTSSETAEGNHGRSNKLKLSEQLRSYYTNHLDPSEMPEGNDIEALEAVHNAQNAFDEKLKTCFEEAITEVQNLGYPGLNDPKITISTKIKPMDGLNHPSALQYELLDNSSNKKLLPLLLPEQYNGLGYQNLISMVFQLMSFRDAWMQVGKAEKKSATTSNKASFLPPLHLVLVEEPEAHLHVQVQQVFIRKAYDILRQHNDLGDKKHFTTQLIVSTHSSHIAHECDFEHLRYFRRMSAVNAQSIPTSTVINLSKVFGDKNNQTAKFVARYLKSAHCDLFFADAAIFIEGSAERMLIPHFIRSKFPSLNQRYLTLLEVGGSHSHRFRPLIETLGLTTLIITDIDSVKFTQAKDKAKVTSTSTNIKRNDGQVTSNTTLKEWIPQKDTIDDLLNLPASEKIETDGNNHFSVRVAYQIPVNISLGQSEEEVLARTFEDALVYENIDTFKTLDGIGLIKKIKELLTRHTTPDKLTDEMFEELKKSKAKAEFALELLFLKEPETLKVPTYIQEGLEWLQSEVCPEKQLLATNDKLSEAKNKPIETEANNES
jgi:predicted ATP-dependent endonuclease of OLD family